MHLYKIYKLVSPEGKRRMMLRMLRRGRSTAKHMRDPVHATTAIKRTYRQMQREDNLSPGKSNIWWNMHSRINN
jgi:hypothetical protein